MHILALWNFLKARHARQLAVMDSCSQQSTNLHPSRVVVFRIGSEIQLQGGLCSLSLFISEAAFTSQIGTAQKNRHLKLRSVTLPPPFLSNPTSLPPFQVPISLPMGRGLLPIFPIVRSNDDEGVESSDDGVGGSLCSRFRSRIASSQHSVLGT